MIDEYDGVYPNPTANPNFHAPTDTLDTLDLGFHARATRAVLASLVAFSSQ